MKLVEPKHPDADDTIYRLKGGIRVRIYNKIESTGHYLVVCVRDGKQFTQKREDFEHPEQLPF